MSIGARILLVPFSRRANHSLTIPEDGKEATRGDRLVLDAVHDQQRTGVTVGHVVAAGVGSYDSLKVLDVLFNYHFSSSDLIYFNSIIVNDGVKNNTQIQ